MAIHSYTHNIDTDGWLMIGGCTSDAKASTTNCNIGVIYGYEQGVGYIRLPESDYLKPAKGYWILIDDVKDEAVLTVKCVGF